LDGFLKEIFMKFRYLVGLLVALNFNNGFAADAEIAAGNYQGAYEAFTQRSAAGINAALQHNQDFNHNNDRDASRRSAAGLALRTAVIGLGFDDLKTVVERNHEFFKTSLGVSLLYGWALNRFDTPVTPYYIGYYFSFDKMFQGLATRVGTIADLGATAKTFLQSFFTRGLAAVEADRWKFYDHMLYLPYAIGQVRKVAPVVGAPSVDMVIAAATRSAMEAWTEAANLVPAKAGRAVHLMDESGFRSLQINWRANSVVGLQKVTIQASELCSKIDPLMLEIFQSLPDGTLDTYVFKGKTLTAHIADFRAAMVKVADHNEISADGYMDYARNKAGYPAKAGDVTFKKFKDIMNRHAAKISAVAADIRALNSLRDEQDLHGDREWGLGDFGYPQRRAAIARVLAALTDYL
jgi:hypothetical protein